MDRNLVNNQIILMRKTVRNVKRLVKQQLSRQIKKLELKLNKNIEKTAKKVDRKIKNKKKEIVSINGVNVDEVSKQALIQTKKYFEDIIKNGQSSAESKALARIAINENVEKVVNKFKEENPNSDQWLPSQIELWQQKKLMKKNRILKKKGLISEPIQQNTEEPDIDSNDSEDMETNESEVKPKQIKENKRKSNLKSKPKSDSKSVDTNQKVLKKPKNKEKTEEIKPQEIVVEQTKPKSDPFFLSNDPNIDEQSENESDEDVRPRNSGKHFKTERFGSKFNKFSKPIERNRNSPQNFKKTNFKPKKFETTQVNRGKDSSMKDRSRSKPNSVPEDLHPSWAARRSAKDKLKINLNSKPLAKKIKFSD